MRRLRVWWNHYWFKPTTCVNLGILRIAVFGAATLFLFQRSWVMPPTFKGWRPISFFQWLPGPFDQEVLISLQVVWLIAGLAAALGLAFRWTGPITFFAALLYWGHRLSLGSIFHSQHLYVMLLGILAFSKADHALSWRHSKKVKAVSGDYRWPLQWVRVYVVFIMTICGLEKLFYSGFEWAFSSSLYIEIFTAPPRSMLATWVLDQPLIVSQLMAAFALFVMEISAPLALIFPRLGWVYFLIWSMMHPMATLLFGGHWSFFSQIAGYVAFVPWQEVGKILKSHISGRIN